jgi:site-specific recombinase XerD
VTTYRASLAGWATWRASQGLTLDPVLATRREAQAWVAHLSATVAPGTAATRAGNLVTFFRWLVQEWAMIGEVRPSPWDHVKLPVARAPRVHSLTEAEVDRLLAACRGTTYRDLRDHAVLALMVSTGLRRGEVAALLVEDVDLLGRRVRVQEGKGDREDWVPFGQVAADALRLHERKRSGHRDATLEVSVGIRRDRVRVGRPLFLVDTGSGHRGGIGPDTVAAIVEDRGAMAGLGAIHPHQLRHTFAHSQLAAGVPEADVMTTGRWRSRTVMARYGADMREARAAASYHDPLARRRR